MRCSLPIGVLISFLLIASVFVIFSFNEVEAQEKVVTTKSIGFEETTIIEFENKGKTEIETIRIWLGKDNTFKSFKTEKGWTGKKTPQGVIVFTTSDPIKAGESVKFGIKTDKPMPGINWKALDENDNQLQIGKTLVSESPSKPAKDVDKPISLDGSSGIFSDSTFRLIPEKPNVGSTIRVTGEKFASNQEFDFYIENKFLESFETNNDGHFIFTTKIPAEQKAERVSFFVKDKQGNEKAVSLRLGGEQSRMAPEEEVRLTISRLPDVVYPGEELLISGTANPGGTVTATIKDPEGNILTTRTADIDAIGSWSHETIIPLNAPLGKYSAEISDGIDTILRNWTLESSKTIQIVPSKLKFEPGDVLLFNGTALPNQSLEIILENPQGSEIFSDIIQPDSSGFFEIEFPTEQSSLEGTYVLFAFQAEKSEVVFVGLGELPKPQLVAEMDKLNYQAGDTAIISISGPDSATLSLLIIDPADKNKFSDTIVLGPDGKKDYELDLSGYPSGVYTTVVTWANSQTNEVFSVGLQTGSGPIEVRVTKDTYEPGDAILILGNSGSNILVILTLLDPDNNEVKVKETFTNKEGVLSESSFRVPTDAKPGVWKIKAMSGPNFSQVEFDVTISMEEGMVVFVESIETIPTIGEVVWIKVLGAAQSVVIDILSQDGELVGHLELRASEAGEIVAPWSVPNDIPPGVYTIQVSDPFNSAETTFTLG